MDQASGNVYGAGIQLGNWLTTRALYGNIGTIETPPFGYHGLMFFLPFNENDPIQQATYYSFQSIGYELVERKGLVALWRLLWCYGQWVTPDPSGDCNRWNFSTFDYLAPGSPFIQPGWGSGPFCGLELVVTPIWPVNLMMLTVGGARQPSELEDYGYEYAVAVAAAADDADLAALWASVLSLHMPSACAFGLGTVTAIPSGSAYPVATSCREQAGSPL